MAFLRNIIIISLAFHVPLIAAENNIASPIAVEATSDVNTESDVNDELNKLGHDIQEYEVRISELENNINKIKEKQGIILQEQESRRKLLSKLLIATYHLSDNFSCALNLSYDEPNKMMHTSLIIKYILKDLKQMTEKVKSEYHKWNFLFHQNSEQQDNLRRTQEVLENKRKNLVSISSEAHLAPLTQQNIDKSIEEIIKNCETVSDLISDLEAEKAVGQLSKVDIKSSINHSDPFSFRHPIQSEISKVHSNNGIIYSTKPKTEVTSPENGMIIFVGPFMQYKTMIIIDHGRGFHTLLSGFDVSLVKPGQTVDIGQPLALMAEKGEEIKLYVELLHERTPLPPKEWDK